METIYDFFGNTINDFLGGEDVEATDLADSIIYFMKHGRHEENKRILAQMVLEGDADDFEKIGVISELLGRDLDEFDEVEGLVNRLNIELTFTPNGEDTTGVHTEHTS